jgi:hypothetical protein
VLIGLGAYFSGQNLFGNNDIWVFAPSAAVAVSSSGSDPNVIRTQLPAS